MPGNTRYESQSLEEARVLPGLFSPRRLARYVYEVGIDLLFPPRCAGCGRVDWVWCENCQEKLDEVVFPSRVQPLSPLAGIAATGVHEGIIREAVQGLKYGQAKVVAQPLGGRLMTQYVRQNWTIDMIIPVPLHISRLAERGYNQAQLLSEVLAKESALPCLPEAVSRQRNTQSQVTLNAMERQTNLLDAFQANPQFVSTNHILLIDDVYTTGATLSACAQAILEAGAQAVYGLTVTVARL
jgi:competence protein ComFC